MTKQQAINLFKESFPALLQKDDYCEKQLVWACFIDGLCKDGTITQKQYDNWDNPSCIGKPQTKQKKEK